MVFDPAAVRLNATAHVLDRVGKKHIILRPREDIEMGVNAWNLPDATSYSSAMDEWSEALELACFEAPRAPWAWSSCLSGAWIADYY